MDVERRVVVRERIQEVDTLRQVGQDLAARLHQGCDGLEINLRGGDGGLQNRLGLGVERLGAELFHVFRVHPAELVDVEDRRRFRDAGDVEHLGQLLQREEFAFGQLALRTPAQKRDIVQHSLGQVAVADKILIARVTVALGHLMLRVAHDRRAVDIGRDLPAEGFVEQVIFWRGGEIFAAADDVCNAHQVVVDDVGEVVGGQAVGLQENLILHLLVLDRNVAEGGVVERGAAFVRDALPDDIWLPCCDAALCLFERKITAGADVLFDLLALFSGFFVGFLAEAVIRAAPFHEQVSIFAEQAAPLGLDIRADRAADVRAFVMVESTFGQRLIDDIDRAVHQAALIGVLDAEDERAVVAAGDQPSIERRAQIADVHVARGAGREAGAHLPFRDARFHFLKKIHRGIPPVSKFISHIIPCFLRAVNPFPRFLSRRRGNCLHFRVGACIMFWNDRPGCSSDGRARGLGAYRHPSDLPEPERRNPLTHGHLRVFRNFRNRPKIRL